MFLNVFGKSPAAEKDLNRLDRPLRRKLIVACGDVFDDWIVGKRLTGELYGLRSHRVDDYRIIYKIQASSEVDIIAIGHRSEIYERIEK